MRKRILQYNMVRPRGRFKNKLAREFWLFFFLRCIYMCAAAHAIMPPLICYRERCDFVVETLIQFKVRIVIRARLMRARSRRAIID